MGFPCPPYEIIDIAAQKPRDIEKYVLDKIRSLGIPNIKGDRIGVTIRVSLPGAIDKSGSHGGLHVVDEKDIIRQVLDKYHEFKPGVKIVIQHTVDARCSGTILTDRDMIIVEIVLGDAPPLLEGHTVNYESWEYSTAKSWLKKRAYTLRGNEQHILSEMELRTLHRYARALPPLVYVEWSIAGNETVYFYEYTEFLKPS